MKSISLQRLCIPILIKSSIIWVEYGVCWDEDWWETEGFAELQIKWGKN